MLHLLRSLLCVAVFLGCVASLSAAELVQQVPEHDAIAAELRKLQAVPIRVPPEAADDEKRTQQIAALTALHKRAIKARDRSLEMEIATEVARLGVTLPMTQILEPKALVHPTTHATYYLESDGRTVTAISPEGKILWHRDPLRDAGIGPYRVAKPVIISFNFADKTDQPKALSIGYNSSQFGMLDLATGKFEFHGQN